MTKRYRMAWYKRALGHAAEWVVNESSSGVGGEDRLISLLAKVLYLDHQHVSTSIIECDIKESVRLLRNGR